MGGTVYKHYNNNNDSNNYVIAGNLLGTRLGMTLAVPSTRAVVFWLVTVSSTACTICWACPGSSRGEWLVVEMKCGQQKRTVETRSGWRKRTGRVVVKADSSVGIWMADPSLKLHPT